MQHELMPNRLKAKAQLPAVLIDMEAMTVSKQACMHAVSNLAQKTTMVAAQAKQACSQPGLI